MAKRALEANSGAAAVMLTSAHVVVVGAGFAGSVVARELADHGMRVIVLERRAHVGGNAFDEYDKNGVLVHRYGPHLFHTNSKRIFDWLSRFTGWRRYEHRVLAKVGEQLLPVPINRTTINRLYGLNLDEEGVKRFLERVREPRRSIRTSEDLVMSSVGPDLCEKFFRGYTKKQWGLDLCELAAGVAARIPTRTNDDDRYFTDKYQAMPRDGHTKMFSRMLHSPNIELQVGVECQEIKNDFSPVHTVYTGPIDAYFDHRFGELPYRSLRFEHHHLPDVPRFQSVGTVNYPNDHDYTRITELKHATGQARAETSIVFEYPQAHGEPYYPIPRAENEELYRRYRALAREAPKVTFVGRLAQYRYYNMDQVVGAVLTAAREVLQVLGVDQVGYVSQRGHV